VLGTEEARELGLYPPPPHSEIFEAVEASQVRYVYVVPDAVEVEFLGDEGKTLSKVVADVAVEERITGPLITDVTIDALGIQVVSFGKGLWRHVDGPKGKIRSSAA